MATVEQKIVEVVSRIPGLSQTQIAREIYGPDGYQQQVNQHLSVLVGRGLIKKEGDSRFKYFPGKEIFPEPAKSTSKPSETEINLTEDQIKVVLKEWLEADGYTVKVAMGKQQGIDIEATRNEERWVIEVKGPGSRDAMRVNYFLAILGETLQRMGDENSRYSIALPDMQQYRNLWARLPKLAKQRTRIDAMFVNSDGKVMIAE